MLAYVLKVVFAVELGWLPPSGISAGWPTSYLLPAICLAIFLIPEITRLTRASVLGNLNADFVDTAVAKGLGPGTVVVRHVLRNSLLPVVSVLGLSLGYLISGSILIEGIFNMPGLGLRDLQRHRPAQRRHRRRHRHPAHPGVPDPEPDRRRAVRRHRPEDPP